MNGKYGIIEGTSPYSKAGRCVNIPGPSTTEASPWSTLILAVCPPIVPVKSAAPLSTRPQVILPKGGGGSAPSHAAPRYGLAPPVPLGRVPQGIVFAKCAARHSVPSHRILQSVRASTAHRIAGSPHSVIPLRSSAFGVIESSRFLRHGIEGSPRGAIVNGAVLIMPSVTESIWSAPNAVSGSRSSRPIYASHVQGRETIAPDAAWRDICLEIH